MNSQRDLDDHVAAHMLADELDSDLSQPDWVTMPANRGREEEVKRSSVQDQLRSRPQIRQQQREAGGVPTSIRIVQDPTTGLARVLSNL